MKYLNEHYESKDQSILPGSDVQTKKEEICV